MLSLLLLSAVVGLPINSNHMQHVLAHPTNQYKTVKMLHITDMHLDPLYQAGTSTENHCHKSDSNRATSTTSRTAGKYGTPESSCDSPILLIDSVLEYCAKHFNNITYIVWTGDNSR